MSAKLYNMSMQIRIAEEKDVEAILNLQTQIYRSENIAPNAQEVLKDQLQDDSCDVLVAEDNGEIIATAAIYYIQVASRGKPYALLEGLVVDQEKRGKGAGTELFKKCIEVAHEKGCYKMLFTSGFDREDAHKFYEKLGFKKWGYEFRMDL